jgi:hypothetical protein|nr:MAG: hypothetical protein [Microvirus sp.]
MKKELLKIVIKAVIYALTSAAAYFGLLSV